MARSPRLELAHADYYLRIAGQTPEGLFQTADDYEAFLTRLGEMGAQWEIGIRAYCLLPNECHLVVHTTYPNLSRALHQLNSGFARYLRAVRGHKGAIVRHRYRATLFEPRIYLRAFIDYVHALPSVSPEGHLWSSARFFAGGLGAPFALERPVDAGDVLTPDRTRERDLLAQMYRGARWPKMLGTVTFKAEMRRRVAAPEPALVGKVSESVLISKFEDLVGMPWEMVRQPHNREAREARRVAMLAYRWFLMWEYKRISTYFNVSSLAIISRIVNRKDLSRSAEQLWKDLQTSLAVETATLVEEIPHEIGSRETGV
jgi:REP element-mobilizing transposase RayT